MPNNDEFNGTLHTDVLKFFGKNESIAADIKAQGFPEFMIWAFVQTAKSTNTIVSSRVPGKGATVLIEEGYDLKGFQVKCKSCDWGPMAGFICKLPFFNKKGFPNINYNAYYIEHLLKSLDKFKPIKSKIDGISSFYDFIKGKNEQAFASFITGYKKSEGDAILNPQDFNKSEEFDYSWLAEFHGTINKLDNPKKKDLLILINKEEGKLLYKYNIENETKQGEWSGENSLTDNSPFVHLKRRYVNAQGNPLKASQVLELFFKENSLTKLAQGYNIIGEPKVVTANSKKYILMTAQDKKATVKSDFLLAPETDGVWAIYHGPSISFSDQPDKIIFEYHGNLQQSYVPLLKDEKGTGRHNLESYNNDSGHFEKMFSYSKKTIQLGEQIYYALEGFMNPEPPYKGTENDNPDYYKNAVAGDYDLFAFWPNRFDVNVHELRRTSEIAVGTQLRMGGKLLTAFIGEYSNLGIEFIPGSDEMKPKKTLNEHPILGEEIKESPRFGTIHSFGHSIIGSLNRYSEACYSKAFPKQKQNVFKAFHSDEGGRPGIMEIEFPVAFFFPFKIKTRALNNVGAQKNTLISSRNIFETYGGLVKNSFEFLQLIIESQNAKGKYRYVKRQKSMSFRKTLGSRKIISEFLVILHSGWLTHLFYISLGELPDKNPINFSTHGKLITTANKYLMDNFKLKKGFDFVSKERYKDVNEEFKKIKENHAKDYINTNENNNEEEVFIKSLKNLVRADNIFGVKVEDINDTNEAYFNDLRTVFLLLPFIDGSLAYNRKRLVDLVLIKHHRIYIDYLDGLEEQETRLTNLLA